MVIRRLSSEEGYRGWFVEWIEEWSQFAGGYNWYTFHPIQIEIEDDRIMGGIEATMILLGLGFRVRWNWRVTEEAAEVLHRVEEVKAAVERQP